MSAGRRGIIIAVVGLVLVVLGMVFVGIILRSAFAPVAAPALPTAITDKVVVLTRDIPIGTVLKDSDVRQVSVPVELVPRGAVRDANDVVGKAVSVSLVSGEMVNYQHLASPTNIHHDLAFTLAEDQVLMAFPAEDLMSRINMLQTGDQVDILASIEEEVQATQSALVAQPNTTQQPEKQLFTFNALQRVRISAFIVDIAPSQSTGTTTTTSNVTGAVAGTPVPTATPQPSQIEPKAVLIAVSEQDALVLKHLKDAGATFDIVLRSPTTEMTVDTAPVMPQYLIERYKLVIKR